MNELPERRRRIQRLAERMPAPAGVTVDAIDVDGVPCEWIRPSVVTDERIVLYFHGGGYAVGGLDTHRKMIGFLGNATGLVTLSVGYRLAPEHPFPAAVDDGMAALSWLRVSGVPTSDIVVAGDSAGGGLAVALCLTARERGWAMPSALVMLSPWLDMSAADPTTHDSAPDDPIVTRANLRELREWYLAGADPADPLASPLRADLTGLPRTLIQVGQREVLCEDAVKFCDRLVCEDIDATCEVWTGMTHVWHFSAGVTAEANAALARIGEWLRVRTGSTS